MEAVKDLGYPEGGGSHAGLGAEVACSAEAGKDGLCENRAWEARVNAGAGSRAVVVFRK